MPTIDLNPFPELITARLLLRQLQPGDASQVFLLRTDDSVNAFIDRQKATSVNDAIAFINKITAIQNNSEGLMWAITLKGRSQLIGTIGIWNVENEKAEAEIGYELLPQYQGKGIMLEAITAAIKFAFETLTLKKIIAKVRADNLRSVNLLKKCGFTDTGETHGVYLIYELIYHR